MRVLKITALLLTIVMLCAQAVRHIYVAYFQPRTSVLDEYAKTDADEAIRRATALEELLVLYDPAKKQVDALDKELKDALASATTREERRLLEEKFQDQHGKEYAREAQLQAAIEDWEHKNQQVTELHVFWAFGIGLFVIGAALSAAGREWLGMSLILPGVVEMLWWTSPSIRFEGCPVEFDRLLFNKIVFTLITLAVVIAAWLLNEFRDKAKLFAAPPDRRG